MTFFGVDMKYGIIESTVTEQPANSMPDLVLPLNWLHKHSQTTQLLGLPALEGESVD